MPAYKHVCNRCSHAIDVICKIDDRNIPKKCVRFVTKSVLMKMCLESVRSDDICDGQGTLQRPENEVEVAAKMTYAWRP